MELSAVLNNLSVKAKIAALAATLLLFTAGLGTFALISMSKINGELKAIAEQDIPLTSKVVKVTLNQLEQAVWFERALRYGEDMVEHPATRTRFDHALSKFLEYSTHVNRDLKSGEELASTAAASAHSPEDAAEFKKVLESLQAIEHEHQAYEQHVEKVFSLLSAGQVATAMPLAEEVEAEEDRIDHELEALVEEIEQFTAKAAKLAEAHEHSAQNTVSVLLATALIVGVLLSWWIGRNMSQRIAVAVALAESVASGDLRQAPRASNSKDEIGRMLSALDAMSNNLRGLVTQIQDASNSLAVSTEQVSTASSQVSVSVDRQRQELEQTATAFNEMNATIQEVSRSASAAADATRKTAKESQQGRDTIADAVMTSRGLAESVQSAATVIHELGQDSEAIGTVIDVIKNIAEQTNLLALNAAIEAARAGEQGRGFAVVADEVRTLAQRTQESTSEIESMIERLQHSSRHAVKTMEEGQEQADSSVGKANAAGESFEEIIKAIDVINDTTVQIASAAEEQTMVSEDINRNLTAIYQGAEESATAVSQTSGASEELAHMAAGLQEASSRFRVA